MALSTIIADTESRQALLDQDATWHEYQGARRIVAALEDASLCLDYLSVERIGLNLALREARREEQRLWRDWNAAIMRTQRAIHAKLDTLSVSTQTLLAAPACAKVRRHA